MKRRSENNLDDTKGIKRRKFNKINSESSEENRELSPADSGFKDLTTTIISISSSQTSSRNSSCIQNFYDENYKLSPTERILKKTLKDQNFIQPLESFHNLMQKFNPKVVLCKFCINFENEMFINRLDLSKMIPKIPIINEIEFQGLILHEMKNFKEGKSKFYVRWFPMNILDDEYVICDRKSLKKKVKIGELNLRQKQIVSEKIFRGIFQ